MPTGDPIAVTLVGQASADSLIVASKQSPALCLLPDHVTWISPAEYFRTLGITGAYLLDHKITTTIIIINTLDQPLTLVGAPWLKHGAQTGYPDQSNRVAGWKPNVEVMWNFTDGPPQHGQSMLPDQIPGWRMHPAKPGSLLYGVGAYRFENSGVYGVDGAMEFAYGGSSYLGITWVTPFQGTTSFVAVTADMSAYASNLETFYNATAGASRNATTAKNKEIDVRANYGFRPKGEGPFTDLNGTSFWDKNPVIIVSVRSV